MNRRRVLALLAGLSAVGFGAFVAPAAGAAVKPTVELSPASGAVGDAIKVQLDHWPMGTAVALVCGNAARNGTPDCALQGAEAGRVAAGGQTVIGMILTAPPTPCPCVVAVSTSDNNTVVTRPVTIAGVPDRPAVDPSGAKAPRPVDPLVVRAGIENRDAWGAGSWAQATMAALGGPAHRTLVLTLHNRGSATLEGLRVDAVVGRNRSSGEHVGARPVGPLPAGARRTLTLPVDITAPAWGHYQVFGRVYGGNEAVEFSAKTSNDPWLLELMPAIVLLLWAQILRRRARARRRAAEGTRTVDGPAGFDDDDGYAAPDLEPLSGSSPDVEPVDGLGFPLPSYAATEETPAAPPAADERFLRHPSRPTPAST